MIEINSVSTKTHFIEQEVAENKKRLLANQNLEIKYDNDLEVLKKQLNAVKIKSEKQSQI